MPLNDSDRFRVDYKTDNEICKVYFNGTLVDSTLFQRWYHYYWMRDKINPVDKSTGRRPPGPCQHLKIDKTYINQDYTYTNGSVAVLTENPDYQSLPDSINGGLSPTGSRTNPNDNGGWSAILFADFLNTPRFADLCFEAWTKLKTQVPAEVSVLNFIYELKDFGPLAKSLSKIPKSVRDSKLGQTFADPLKGKGKIRKSAKAVNNTFLSYNFMWAPFVGDLQKLTTVSDSAAKRLDFLRKTRKKEVTVRFNKVDCYVNPLLNVPQERGIQSDDWKRTFTLTKYQCDFIVTCKLYQDLEGLDDAWAGLRATIATLGINNPVKAAWAAVPFSFLADWVAPIGKWLERAAVQPFYGVWKVYDITTSVRERSEAEFKLSARPGRSVSLPETLICRVKGDNYVRLVGLPQTLGAIDFSQLTSQQQKLFLSLVLTKVL